MTAADLDRGYVLTVEPKLVNSDPRVLPTVTLTLFVPLTDKSTRQ